VDEDDERMEDQLTLNNQFWANCASQKLFSAPKQIDPNTKLSLL
jgi:hypothetical protein